MVLALLVYQTVFLNNIQGKNFYKHFCIFDWKIFPLQDICMGQNQLLFLRDYQIIFLQLSCDMKLLMSAVTQI